MAIVTRARRAMALGEGDIVVDGSLASSLDRWAMLGDYLPYTEAALPITWAVDADFDRNASYEAALTSYVSKPGSGATIQRGINPDGLYRVSSVSLGLNNNDGRFSDRNSASPYYGQMNPDVPVRITALFDGVYYTLWTGYIASWRREWATGTVPMVNVDAWDIAHYMLESDAINVSLSNSRDTDGALDAILDAWEDRDGTDYIPSGDRTFDDGLQALPYHFAVGEKIMAALMAAVRSEPGLLWVTALGKLRFEARDSRLGITVDDTWGDGTSIYPTKITDLTDDMDYITSVRARASVFATGQEGVEVFRFSRGADTKPTADSIVLASGETYRRTFQLAAPVATITTPAATTDYRGNTAADGSGTDRTANLTVSATLIGSGYVDVSIKNTHASSVYVTLFRLRAQPVAFFYGDHPEALVELSVPGRPAGKGLEIDKPFAGDSDPYQLVNDAMSVLRTYRYAVPRQTHTYLPKNATERAKFLALELGQLIKFDDTDLGATGSYTNDWFYVEALAYHIPPDWAGQSFIVEVTLTPSYVFRNLDAIAWDDFARGNATGDLGTTSSGDTWANDGSMDIVSEAARASSDSLQMPDIDLGVTDGVAEVLLSNIGTGDEVGLVFRKEDADNQYRVYLDKGSNELILEKNVATVVTEIASPAFTVGTAHELRVMWQGSRIRVWADFTLLIDTTDTALTAGTKYGLFARNASGTTTFDMPYGQGL